ILLTSENYIKRTLVSDYRRQNRGGKGKRGMTTKEEDVIDQVVQASSHDYLLFFTNMGRIFRLKAYEVPAASLSAKGVAAVNLLQLQPGEKIAAVIPIDVKQIADKDNMFMATRKGIVKKTPIKEFANIRKTGIQAIGMRDDDELIEVKLTDSDCDIILVTKLGQCIRFKETDVRPTGRSAMGVIGMNLLDEDEVVGMQLDKQGDSLLIVSENGLGKRTDINEFVVQHRGGKGVKCYKINEKTGNVVGVKAVDDTREVMLITTDGIIIQIKCDDISNLGRITSGVKLINLDEGVKVATIAKVRKKPVDENDKDADGFEEESQEKSAVVSEADSQPEGEKEPESEIDASIDELLERAEKDKNE
ncbi:MAG: hypothetical protein KH121_08000, partial [Eubacterium sp.]|nr:hypothetical protein [Eubacterium sp.]